jgi:hypothetical protein
MTAVEATKLASFGHDADPCSQGLSFFH